MDWYLPTYLLWIGFPRIAVMIFIHSTNEFLFHSLYHYIHILHASKNSFRKKEITTWKHIIVIMLKFNVTFPRCINFLIYSSIKQSLKCYNFKSFCFQVSFNLHHEYKSTNICTNLILRDNEYFGKIFHCLNFSRVVSHVSANIMPQ